MFSWLIQLLFPPKCRFCQKVLPDGQTDLCHKCRCEIPEFSRSKRKIHLIAQWTAVWYYKDNVRNSIRRFKFHNARCYADFYAKQLAMKLMESPFLGRCSAITWVPVSARRLRERGYDQARLLAEALGRELNLETVCGLKKIRHTQPQSGMENSIARRANVFNAFKGINAQNLVGKQVLLVDDIVTTGYTASECAKALLLNGATHIYFAAVAAAANEKTSR